MNTPIVDFVEKYIQDGVSRFHMPGHKGHVFFGCEPFDITEIKGADVLHHADGIIRESEQNATKLFGSGRTCYSTEGSSLCIRAMLGILLMERGQRDKRAYILAARNVHRSMIDGCALLDLDVEFIRPDRFYEQHSLCSCVVSAKGLIKALAGREDRPLAVYVTSPDYMGQTSDIKGLAAICEEKDIPLLVDNAHGAYMHFLEKPMHPLDLGATMCCDSAHKTLPVLTGGAYLHIHKKYASRYEKYVASAMSLFGSTSPSYLILQSLDMCNRYLADNYTQKLAKRIQDVAERKQRMQEQGICIAESEPLKIVIETWKAGYCGEEIGEELREYGIECEYADWEAVVLMFTLENTDIDWARLQNWADSTKLRRKRQSAVLEKGIARKDPRRAMSIREAVFSESEMIPVTKAKNRICAAEVISCPPAIPIAVCGERIDDSMIVQFEKYHIQEISVVCNNGNSGM